MKFKKYSFREWKNSMKNGKKIDAPFYMIILNGYVRLLTLFRYTIDFGDTKK